MPTALSLDCEHARDRVEGIRNLVSYFLRVYFLLFLDGKWWYIFLHFLLEERKWR